MASCLAYKTRGSACGCWNQAGDGTVRSDVALKGPSWLVDFLP